MSTGSEAFHLPILFIEIFKPICKYPLLFTPDRAQFPGYLTKLRSIFRYQYLFAADSKSRYSFKSHSVVYIISMNMQMQIPQSGGFYNKETQWDARRGEAQYIPSIYQTCYKT